MASGRTEKSGTPERRTKSLDSTLKEKYESFWMYDESHSWRLFQHITLRGAFMGATFGLVGGLPYSLWRKKGQVLSSVGKTAFRGTVIGGTMMGLVAIERVFRLDPVGVSDRSYRLAYNWGQTKWDYIAMDGALVGMTLLRRPFGGFLHASAVGLGLGTLAYIGMTIIEVRNNKASNAAALSKESS